jgi:hypothetical protein
MPPQKAVVRILLMKVYVKLPNFQRDFSSHVVMLLLIITASVKLGVNYKSPRNNNGRSPLFNQLFGSFVNFLLKFLFSIVGGDKAAKHSGKLRYRLTKAIASKTVDWK